MDVSIQDRVVEHVCVDTKVGEGDPYDGMSPKRLVEAPGVVVASISICLLPRAHGNSITIVIGAVTALEGEQSVVAGQPLSSIDLGGLPLALLLTVQLID